MGDLILYLGITLVGYILGSRLRSVRQNLGWTGKVQLVALVILVLLMGMRMGSNEEVTANISTIGVSAFLMTVVIMSFSGLSFSYICTLTLLVSTPRSKSSAMMRWQFLVVLEY